MQTELFIYKQQVQYLNPTWNIGPEFPSDFQSKLRYTTS